MTASLSVAAEADVAGQSAQAELCDFATSLLEHCGGAVEWDRPAEAGIAVLPARVAQMMGVGETAPLVTRPEPDALCLSLASDFLDAAQVVLESLVARVGAFQIPDQYLKRGDLQTAVSRAFTWHNARVCVQGAEPQSVDYHSWWFFASLKSEDVWEAQLNVTINAASRAAVDLPDILSLPELEPCESLLATAPADTFDAAVKVCQSRVLHTAAGYITRMESRLDRDRQRLRDYYGALVRDAGAAKRRSGPPPSEEEVAARGRAVDLELDRKLVELKERYEMQGSLAPIALACLRLNVLAIELAVQRKRAARTVHVYWNPLTKRIEPLCCTRCGRGTYSVAFTDEDVATLCADCHLSRVR